MMIQKRTATLVMISIVCGLLLVSVLCAGCTSTSGTAPATTAPATLVATPLATPAPQPITVAAAAVPVKATATAMPAPVYTSSEGNVIAYTAASLKGASPTLATGFEQMYPGHHVIFNLDGTQALTTQVQNGAYADVFISASNTYTTQLKNGGYFVDATVQPLTTNYVTVIVPAGNPGKIISLADLSRPGLKIAMAAPSVPVGAATYTALSNLAKSTYGADWNTSVFGNVVTYETAEPNVASKVSLGEVDAGFVYESTAAAAPANTYIVYSVPKKDNYLQTYSIGVMKQSTSKGAAADFENFMLSSSGQQILKDYGFRPVS